MKLWKLHDVNEMVSCKYQIHQIFHLQLRGPHQLGLLYPMGLSKLYTYMYQLRNDRKNLYKKGIIPWVGNICGRNNRLVEV